MREIREILKVNAERYAALQARYNPITGEGVPGDRVRLCIPDYPVPVQFVPRPMYDTKLIRLIVKYGSIESFLERHPFEEGTPTFDEVVDEIRKLRHKHDLVNWCFEQIKIEDRDTKLLVPYRLNAPQLEVYETMEELRLSNKPIFIIIDKARQWGGSTFSIFYQFWIALMWRPGFKINICAQVESTAEGIVKMLKDAIANYNPFDLGLPPDAELELVEKKTGYTICWKGEPVRRNEFRVGSVIRPDKLRGRSVDGFHASEVGVWPDTPKQRPEDLIKSIAGGIRPIPYNIQVMESTAKGTGNFFHREWKRAIEGKSAFRPVFVSWMKIIYDTLPVEDEEAFATWLWEHREDNDPQGGWLDSGKHYWWLWTLGATLQGINWYRHKRREFNDYADMASEAPSTWQESFQFSGSKVFSIYDIERISRECRECKVPLRKGLLISDSDKGRDVLRNIQFKETPGGEFWVWDKPDRTPMLDRYIVCVDIGGRSRNADYSVIRVFDRAPVMFDDGIPVLVAQMRYHTDHSLLAYDAMRIAAWYNNALLVIESNTLETKNPERIVDGNMSEYVLNIVGEIYPNLYARKRKEEDVSDGSVTKWGFHTNTSTKPKIIGLLIDCVKNGLWVERDEYMCDELALYEQIGNEYNAAKGAGNHDDVLMATAIGLWVSYKEMDTPRFIEYQDVSSDRVSVSVNSMAVM